MNICLQELPTDLTIASVKVWGCDMLVAYYEEDHDERPYWGRSLLREVHAVKLGKQWVYAVEALNDAMIQAINAELMAPEEAS